MEQAAIKILIELLDADTTPAAPGFVVHIAHLADSGSLPLIKVRVKATPARCMRGGAKVKNHSELVVFKRTGCIVSKDVKGQGAVKEVKLRQAAVSSRPRGPLVANCYSVAAW